MLGASYWTGSGRHGRNAIVQSLQAVERLLDIDRIRQQAALHKMLTEIGIPRLFSSRHKTGMSSFGILTIVLFCK